MISIATLIFLGLVFLIALNRPAWAVAVVLIMFPIEQSLQASSSFFRTHGSLANFSVGSLVVLSLVGAFLRGKLVWSRWITPSLVTTALLYGWAGLSVLWTFSPEWLAEYIRWTSPYIMVSIGLAPLLVGSLDDLKELRIALLVIGTVVALLIIANPNFQFVEGRLVVNVDVDSRTNPLAIGALGGLLVLLSILGPAKERHQAILVLRIVAFVAGLGLGFMSGSRGEVIAGILGAALFLPMARRINNPAQFFGTLGVALAFLVGVLVIRSFFVGADNSERWSSESILFGSAGRLENAVDLGAHYLQRPMFWLIGLGSAAFHDLPTRSGDPYSHVMVADLIFELGLPGVVMAITLALITITRSRSLFAQINDQPESRALVTFLSAFVVYQFVLANKAGIIWAQYDLFFGLCLIGRLSLLQRDADTVAAALSPSVDDGLNFEETEDAGTEADPRSPTLTQPL
jgi:hypothetical protein